MSRLLTEVERIAFLARHPVVAARVGVTQQLLNFGLLEDSYDPGWWDNIAWQFGFDPVVGYIPTWGEIVRGDTLGDVLIDPVPAQSAIYYNLLDPSDPIDRDVLDDPVYIPENPNDKTLYDLLLPLAIGLGAVLVISRKL